MAPPAVYFVVFVIFFKVCDGVFDCSVSRCPFFKVREVEFCVLVFQGILEAYGAPEGFDVTEHVTAEGPEAGHPIAIPAPEEVGAGEALEFVAG